MNDFLKNNKKLLISVTVTGICGLGFFKLFSNGRKKRKATKTAETTLTTTTTISAQTDNNYNLNEWNALQNKVDELQNRLNESNHLLKAEKSSKLEIERQLQDVNNISTPINDENVDLKKRLNAQETEIKHLQSEIIKNKENYSKSLNKLSAQLSEIKIINGNNKIKLYNNHLLFSCANATGSKNNIHAYDQQNIDYILDFESIQNIIAYWSNYTHLHSKIIQCIYEKYHKLLNVKMVFSDTSPKLIRQNKDYHYQTKYNLSCFRFPKYNKLLVGFQIKIKQISSKYIIDDNDEGKKKLFTFCQSISTFDDKSSCPFYWKYDDNSNNNFDADENINSYYFEENDLLAFFLGDDGILYAFRNGIFVASDNYKNKTFFEFQYGFIDIPYGSKIEIIYDLSNIRWKGVICPHLNKQTLFCTHCHPNNAQKQKYVKHLPISVYQNYNNLSLIKP